MGVSGAVLGAIAANVIRLGPSSIVLPENALTVNAAWYRFPDLDPEYDYYSIVVTLVNGVDTPSVYPYAVEMNLTVIGGQSLDHMPLAGDYTGQKSQPLSWGGSPPDLTLNLPAGTVTAQDREFYMRWDVAGKTFLGSRPVFTTSADFFAEFRVPENESLSAHPEVTVNWYHANPLQAYPVAMRARNVTCYYVPGADSEGTAPYGGCG